MHGPPLSLLLTSLARLVAMRLCIGVPPDIANIAPSKNSLLKSAARSIARYSASLKRWFISGTAITARTVAGWQPKARRVRFKRRELLGWGRSGFGINH